MRFLTHDNMKLHPALYIPWVASVYLRVCFHRGGAKGLDSLWGTILGPWGRGRFPFQSLLPLSGAFVQYSPPRSFSRRSIGSRSIAGRLQRNTAIGECRAAGHGHGQSPHSIQCSHGQSPHSIQ